MQITLGPHATWTNRIGMLTRKWEDMQYAKCSWDEMNLPETVAMLLRMGMSSAQCN